jgi:hypothetical protein
MKARSEAKDRHVPIDAVCNESLEQLTRDEVGIVNRTPNT